MQKLCAWCGQSLAESEVSLTASTVVSHGLCPTCAFHLHAQLGMPLLDYLDGLPTPIILVDENRVVQAANRAAEALLHKSDGALRGHKGGEVFECVHARLPEGCGQTIHCSGCTIRRCVAETYHSGRPCVHVPATLKKGKQGEPEVVRFAISTIKVGDLVLLRVDEVG